MCVCVCVVVAAGEGRVGSAYMLFFFFFSCLPQFVILEIFSITGYNGETPLPFLRCSSYFLITCSCSCFPDFNCQNHRKAKIPKPKKKTTNQKKQKGFGGMIQMKCKTILG